MIVVIFFAVLFYSIAGSKSVPDSLDEDIYTEVSSEAKCIRLLTANGRQGCATLSSGESGRLVLIDSQEELEKQIATPPDFGFLATMNIVLLNRDNINRLYVAANGYLRGVVFLTDIWNNPPSGYSPDDVSPLKHLSPHGEDNVFSWNTNGDGFLYEDLEFPMIALNSAQSSTMRARAQENLDNLNSQSFASQDGELKYPMYSKVDSRDCLLKDQCLPLGGYSVWSTYADMSSSSYTEKPLVIASAQMDTTAIMHQYYSIGADSAMSGLVVLLAAAQSLIEIKEELKNLTRQIVFTAFTGEVYDLVGSRKFIRDIKEFNCLDFMSVHDNPYAQGCWRPYATSLDFQKLNLENIDAFIEVNQVGMTTSERTLYIHREKTANAKTDLIIDALQNATETVTADYGCTIRVAEASSDLPGVPPSSYWSFLNNDPDTPGVVLADHKANYTNPYWHSVFDTIDQIEDGFLCQVSALYARTIYRIAAGDQFDASIEKSIRPDCRFVETLVSCLMDEPTCSLIKEFTSDYINPSRYTSVYKIIQDYEIKGFSQFIYRFLANATGDEIERSIPCGTTHASNPCYGGSNFMYACGKKTCVRSTTHFHAAVEPNITFNYAKEVWEMPDDMGELHAWTESTWSGSAIGSRFYKRESPAAALVTFFVGIGIFLITCCLVWRAEKTFSTKFKVL